MKIIDKNSLPESTDRPADNIILIDKPAEWTSFDVVKKIKNIGRFNKVGHAGTLDPIATGLLILGTGSRTRELTAISNAGKSYGATIRFGKMTNTYDRTGVTIQETNIDILDKTKIESALAEFLGETEQSAPPFSAKKVDGIRLYKLARKGEMISIQPHKIRISEIKILNWDGLNIHLYIQCSKGTYIRSLAHDLGLKTGYGAHLLELKRISIDGYLLENALQIVEFEKYWRNRN